MNKRLIAFNIFYYTVIGGLFLTARKDPSSSLGYGYFIAIFCGVALIALVLLAATKNIRLKTMLDWVLFFLATPVLLMAMQYISLLSYQQRVESGYNVGDYRYREITYYFHDDDYTKERIEYYRNAYPNDPKTGFPVQERWVKDSIWVYFSKQGDTLKKVSYRSLGGG